MDFKFAPDNFVGRQEDDNTLQGLLRRMAHAGLITYLLKSTVLVSEDEPWADRDAWIRSIEAHYGCKHVPDHV